MGLAGVRLGCPVLLVARVTCPGFRCGSWRGCGNRCLRCLRHLPADQQEDFLALTGNRGNDATNMMAMLSLQLLRDCSGHKYSMSEDVHVHNIVAPVCPLCSTLSYTFHIASSTTDSACHQGHDAIIPPRRSGCGSQRLQPLRQKLQAHEEQHGAQVDACDMHRQAGSDGAQQAKPYLSSSNVRVKGLWHGGYSVKTQGMGQGNGHAVR